MPSKDRGRGRDGRPWRRIVAEMRMMRLPCCICGQAIDYRLPYNHPQSFTVDHRIPRSVAPWLAEDRDNLDAAHRSCNSKRSNGRSKVKPVTSRRW